MENRYLMDKDGHLTLNSNYKMDRCHICKIPIDRDEDTFYQQRLVEDDKIIPVLLCEDCMAELHKCPQCGLAKPYCGECI